MQCQRPYGWLHKRTNKTRDSQSYAETRLVIQALAILLFDRPASFFFMTGQTISKENPTGNLCRRPLSRRQAESMQHETESLQTRRKRTAKMPSRHPRRQIGLEGAISAQKAPSRPRRRQAVTQSAKSAQKAPNRPGKHQAVPQGNRPREQTQTSHSPTTRPTKSPSKGRGYATNTRK